MSLRTRNQRLLNAIFNLVAVGFAAWGVWLGLAADPALWEIAAPCLGVACGMLWIGVRAWRAGVLVEDDGLIIRNQYRSYEVLWDDVSEVTLEAYGRFPCIGVVRLRSGREIPTYGIRGSQGSLRVADREAREAIQVLSERQRIHDGCEAASRKA